MPTDENLTHRQRRQKRTFKVVMIIAIAALVLRGLLFLIEDSANMSPEEGARLKPVEMPMSDKN